MSDDFFEELDKKIGAHNAKEQARVDRKEADTAFSIQAIAEMHPVAQRYVEKLRERGINAKVGGGERGITFEMKWADHGEHGLSVFPAIETGRLEIVRNSTDHTDGKRFRSTDGSTYGESNWDVSKFESALRSVINDYVFYADKHKGIA